MRWIVVCVLVAGGFWYYSKQQRPENDPGTMDAVMQECLSRARYVASRSGTSDARAREECAAKHNLYHEDGHWHRY